MAEAVEVADSPRVPKAGSRVVHCIDGAAAGQVHCDPGERKTGGVGNHVVGAEAGLSSRNS